MTFAKTFGQRHVLRFLDSHVDLFGCRVTAASPVGLRVTDGVHQLCLKSTDGCIQREDAPNSVAPELIEDYGSTVRRTAATRRGELSRMPRRLTLQQAVELPESLLRHFLSHPQLSDVDVRRLVDTGSVDEDAYTSSVRRRNQTVGKPLQRSRSLPRIFHVRERDRSSRRYRFPRQ